MNQALKEQLRKLIEDATLASFDDDDQLMGNIIDSMTSVDIIMKVKQQFGCAIPSTEADVHLESLNTLVDYVEAHRNA